MWVNATAWDNTWVINGTQFCKPFIYLWCLPWSQSCVNSTDKESRLGPNVCNPFQLWLTWYPQLLQHALLFSHTQARFAYIVLDIALLSTPSAVQWSIVPLSFLHYPHTHMHSHTSHTHALSHLTLHTWHSTLCTLSGCSVEKLHWPYLEFSLLCSASFSVL